MPPSQLPPLQTSEYTLHIALTNLPQKDSSIFVDKIKEHLFKQYRENSEKYLVDGPLDENLFNPLEYYIFGSYDIAFISLVDRFKFSQKLFVPPPDNTSIESKAEPHIKKGNNYDSTAFQIISGVCPVINNEFKPQQFFQKQRKSKNSNRFVTICNLKLNNKLLIGNGIKLYDQVVRAINSIIKEMFGLNDESIKNKYFIMQSFSWFEISIVLFTDKLRGWKNPKSKKNASKKEKSDLSGSIKTFIGKLRILTLKDLEFYTGGAAIDNKSSLELFNNSLYKTDDNCSLYNGANVFLFADSHSYIGVRKEVLNNTNIYKEKIQTQIEAQLKPGYLKEFKKTIAQIKYWNSQSIHDPDKDSQSLITGKYDYQFQLKSKNIAANLALIKAITSPGIISEELGKYTRKLKTSIIFDYDPIADNDSHEQIEFRHILKRKFIEDLNINISRIDQDLKRLKVSRLIRGKVGKIFYNYINSIQDSILFVFMLDIVDFISFLKKFIEDQKHYFASCFDNDPKFINSEFEMVDKLEKKLVEIIDIIQKSYQLRLLNSYQFEDINDFDLDYNSSPQQILTSYNSIAKELQRLFFTPGNNYSFPDSPVISINLRNTVATAYSINYDVFHLISPEFIFFTILKEILNKYREVGGKDGKSQEFSLESRMYKNIVKCSDEIHDWISDHKYFSTLKECGLAKQDIDNIYLDYVRLALIFNFNYKMFVTWSWTYNFQNAALYDNIGLMNESHFRKELIRVLFVGYLTGNDEEIEKLVCPLPEVQVYWSRYFNIYKKEFIKMFEKENDGVEKHFKSKVIQKMKIAIDDFFDMFLNQALPERVNSILGTDIIFNRSYSDFIQQSKRLYDQEEERLLNDMKNGKPILFDEEKHNAFIFISQLAYTYLKYIYSENKERVNLVRRKWEDGMPLSCFIKYHPEKCDWLYNIDQIGGLFFTNNKRAKQYFKMRNSVMLSIWHMGMILKKMHFFK